MLCCSHLPKRNYGRNVLCRPQDYITTRFVLLGATNRETPLHNYCGFVTRGLPMIIDPAIAPADEHPLKSVTRECLTPIFRNFKGTHLC